MIERVEQRLAEAGYERYEISNYARSDRRSRHNARYWLREAVLGIGVGAHSFDPRTDRHPHGLRRANPRSLEAWLKAVESEPGRVGRDEVLSPETARGEAVFLALRRREGLACAPFAREFGRPPRTFFEAEIEKALAFGWILEGDPAPGDLRLTPAGRLVADSVAALFVAGGGADVARGD